MLDGTSSSRAERLRSLRTELAGGKPAYTVFSNATLELLAVDPPVDRDSFLAVKGLGPAKWQAFGEAVLTTLSADAAAE